MFWVCALSLEISFITKSILNNGHGIYLAELWISYLLFAAYWHLWFWLTPATFYC